MTSLRSEILRFPAIDPHAHNLLRGDLDGAAHFLRAFSEAHDRAAVEEVRSTLLFRRGLRDVAELLGCDAAEGPVLARRQALGLDALTRLCVEASNLRGLLLDDGFRTDEILPTAWHGQFLPVRRLLRVETVAEGLLRSCDVFDDFEDRFRARMESPGADVVAYKSVACYRTGLDVQIVARDEAREHFLALKRRPPDRPVRLADKPLVDYLLGVTLQVAARRGLPVQLHTGFGDPDLDLRLANPLHLRTVLEAPRFQGVHLVLLHGAYPFTREAGYLASVYPQVHIDLGLAVPLLSVAGMRATLGQLLEAAPWTRVLYSSDAHFIPETIYLGAKWGRRVLADVLEESVRDGDLSDAEALTAARAILADNAARLYRL